ncbi:acyltransferase family protein [Nocardioides sp. Soil774]|uniref:acyltransferase family protein n=1 Tax=Nocardioides sp. Soil774 TaxID=1736408 RepID=UPI000A59C690|nr:acyltransferase [Nocardioides sp. Soil774]
MDAGDGWQPRRRLQLDVIRAAAILVVVACHAGFLPPLAGNVGVTMFFALSGFLITTLLLEEHRASGAVSLRRFYFRRACRLFPALMLFLAAMGVVTWVSQAPVVASGRDFVGAILYVGNYTTAMQGRDSAIGHTWSLAIEEQFYIVWPCVLIVVLALGRGRFAFATLVAGLGSLTAVVLRLMLWDDGRGVLRVHFGADTRMDGLLIGCLAALWLHTRAPGRAHPWAAAGLLGLVASSSMVEDPRVAVLVLPTLVAAATSLAIVLVAPGPAVGLFASPKLQLVGRRSYGIYLWHHPLVGGAAALAAPGRWPALLLAALLTALVVHLSWRCVEEPFLRLKDRVGHVRAEQLEISLR